LHTLSQDEQILLLQTFDPKVLVAAMQQQLHAKKVPNSPISIQGCTDEKRQANRRRVFFPAKIIYNGRLCVISCQIRDISETGCKLRIPNTAAIPNKFTLQFSEGNISKACEVVWREETSLGVRFMATS
jgi:hypothetical protein